MLSGIVSDISKGKFFKLARLRFCFGSILPPKTVLFSPKTLRAGKLTLGHVAGWYGHHLAADKADVYDYHYRTFGPDVVYDDFFDNFTAANWDPKEWVDLIDEAGAQYFVLTTKHHDGFALFDTMQTTNRSSINYGPKRDIVQELFDAAKTYQPHLRRGTYFSLPEWYILDF